MDSHGLSDALLLPLTPLDQTAPRIYVRTVFAFRIRSGYNSEIASQHLQKCFRNALLRWPFAAGQFRPAPGGHSRLELAYKLDYKATDPSIRPDIFCFERVDKLAGKAFKELTDLGMPPEAMDKDVLSLSPDHPKPGQICPPVTLKVTEVSREGLMLCFSTHHGVFDGCFIKTFLEYFGHGTRSADWGVFLHEVNVRPSICHHVNADPSKVKFAEYDFSLNQKITRRFASARAPTAVCKIFQFDNEILHAIRRNALDYLRHKYDENAFVSMADVLSALVWVHVTRARLPHLLPSDAASFTQAVDARARLTPPFPASAWGNIYTQTVAIDQVSSLVQLKKSNKPPADALPAVYEAARKIRQAVERVREPSYIPSRIALAASQEDPTVQPLVFRKADRPDHARLDCSVWTHQGADVDFRVPGTGGKADFVRKTWSANDGAMNILQRRGVMKGDAPWEVLLALRADDMERICGMEELGRWVSRFIPSA